MSTRDYTIRTMTRQEIDLAIDWAADEGWNPGLHDGDCFYAADPEGFLVGLLDGQPIAAISAVKYGQSFGFVGFYIVKPAMRGKGYGLQIWHAGLQRLAGRTIGLDGVVAQQDNYRKSGFALACNNVRYQGRGAQGKSVCPDIVALSSVPWAELVAYDKVFFADDRTAFLKCWIHQPQATALAIRQQGQLAGYGMVRTCRSGHKIGPLFADTPVLAESLFTALQAQVSPNADLFLDVPANNPAAVALATHHAMQPVFETARMYKGPAPTLDQTRTFGITSFELG